ncbi:9795_t:CDS:1, partial [Cetraspora pellucida]
SDANVDGFEASVPDDDGRLYYKPIDERYTYIRMFQHIDKNYQNIKLHDIVIYLSLISYH